MIRQALLQDSARIFQIFIENALDLSRLNDNFYVQEISKIGFIIGDEKEEDFKNLIKEKKYSFIYKEDRILGFFFGDHDTDYIDDENKTWFDLEAKELYYTDSATCSLGLIVIDKSSKGRGIATKLLKHFEGVLRRDGYRYLFSMVRFLPVTNEASIQFHLKNGFKKIAESKPTTKNGLENSASYLFFKKIYSK